MNDAVQSSMSTKHDQSDSSKPNRLKEGMSSNQAVKTPLVSSASSLGEKNMDDKQAVLRRKRGRGSKTKKIYASGTVSTALGKEYLKGSQASDLPMGNRVLKVAKVCGKKEDQIRKMPGEKHGLADVGDGNGQSRHDVGEFAGSLSDCHSQSYESKHHDDPCWNHLDVTSGECIEFDVSQEVLESLFNISGSPQHEARTVDLSHIAKEDKLFGNDSESHKEIVANGDELKVLGKEARQNLELNRSFCQKAKNNSEMHQQSVKEESRQIFMDRNKNFCNKVIIDLHGQRVKQAMKILKDHLSLPSIKILWVITGQGLHSGGKSVLKQSVIELLDKERIKYAEVNPGRLLITLDQHRSFEFKDAESDSN